MTPRRSTYHSGPATVAIGVVVAMGAAVTLSAGIYQFAVGNAAGLVVAFVGVGFLHWISAIALAPKLRILESEIVVDNPVFVYRVPLNAIEEVRPGRKLEIALTSGRTVSCWAIQKSNLALAARRAGRSDRVAAELVALGARGSTSAEVSRRISRAPFVFTCLGALVALGAALLAAYGS